MRCAPLASNGPNHLGLSALQMNLDEWVMFLKAIGLCGPGETRPANSDTPSLFCAIMMAHRDAFVPSVFQRLHFFCELIERSQKATRKFRHVSLRHCHLAPSRWRIMTRCAVI